MLETLGCGVASAVFSGCGKPGAEGTAPANSQTEATATSPPRLPTTIPAETRLIIDGQPALFPRAHAQVQGTSPLSISLFSDKGPEAGNSFFLDMTFDGIDELAELDGATWQLMRPEERTDDLLTTLSIDGGTEQLQPQEVNVIIACDGTMLRARLSGRWGLFTRPDAAAPDRAVLITGEMVATVAAS